jgi:hypothetical protein
MGLTASLSSRASVLALCGIFAFASLASAQTLKSIQTSDKPLALKARGSFFVGGR